ncbi:damage-inducible protein, partial [Escherichia coli]|nr:damage-inducible protein [Escherichia coli]
VVGPMSLARTLRTGSDDRVANMWAFAQATLELFVEVLEATPADA